MIRNTIIGLLVTVATLQIATASDDARYAVVINKNCTVKLEERDISRLFLGKIRVHVKNELLIPYIQEPTSDIGTAFLKHFLRKRPPQYKSHWMNMVFTGEGVAPEVIDDDQKMLKLIAGKQNAIGIIRIESVDDRVKVLAKF